MVNTSIFITPSMPSTDKPQVYSIDSMSVDVIETSEDAQRRTHSIRLPRLCLPGSGTFLVLADMCGLSRVLLDAIFEDTALLPCRKAAVYHRILYPSSSTIFDVLLRSIGDGPSASRLHRVNAMMDQLGMTACFYMRCMQLSKMGRLLLTVGVFVLKGYAVVFVNDAFEGMTGKERMKALYILEEIGRQYGILFVLGSDSHVHELMDTNADTDIEINMKTDMKTDIKVDVKMDVKVDVQMDVKMDRQVDVNTDANTNIDMDVHKQMNMPDHTYRQADIHTNTTTTTNANTDVNANTDKDANTDVNTIKITTTDKDASKSTNNVMVVSRFIAEMYHVKKMRLIIDALRDVHGDRKVLRMRNGHRTGTLRRLLSGLSNDLSVKMVVLRFTSVLAIFAVLLVLQQCFGCFKYGLFTASTGDHANDAFIRAEQGITFLIVFGTLASFALPLVKDVRYSLRLVHGSTTRTAMLVQSMAECLLTVCHALVITTACHLTHHVHFTYSLFFAFTSLLSARLLHAILTCSRDGPRTTAYAALQSPVLLYLLTLKYPLQYDVHAVLLFVPHVFIVKYAHFLLYEHAYALLAGYDCEMYRHFLRMLYVSTGHAHEMGVLVCMAYFLGLMVVVAVRSDNRLKTKIVL